MARWRDRQTCHTRWWVAFLLYIKQRPYVPVAVRWCTKNEPSRFRSDMSSLAARLCSMSPCSHSGRLLLAPVLESAPPASLIWPIALATSLLTAVGATARGLPTRRTLPLASCPSFRAFDTASFLWSGTPHPRASGLTCLPRPWPWPWPSRRRPREGLWPTGVTTAALAPSPVSLAGADMMIASLEPVEEGSSKRR